MAESANISEEDKPPTPSSLQRSDDESEDKNTLKDQSESGGEDDSYHMRLRRNKSSLRSNSSRKERRGKPQRGRKAGQKRRAQIVPRGRKRRKPYDGKDWDDIGDSESEEQPSKYDYPTEISTIPVVEKFLYKPGIPWPDLTPFLHQLIEIRVAKEYISPKNIHVSRQQLWGNDVYTSDSDIVAALHHLGLINVWQSIGSQYEGISILARVTKGRNNYASVLRNGIRSRKIQNYEGHSIKPERIIYLTALGNMEELVEMAEKMPTDYPKKRYKPDLNPKGMRLVPGTHMIFNLSFELAIPYSLSNFGDKGWDENVFVVNKLKRQALYVETATQRFELSQVPENDNDEIFKADRYRWAEVVGPILYKDDEFMQKNVIPLQEKWLNVIDKNLTWQEIEWGSDSVFVKDMRYGPLKCFKYLEINEVELQQFAKNSLKDLQILIPQLYSPLFPCTHIKNISKWAL